jgi:hypothetical protein
MDDIRQCEATMYIKRGRILDKDGVLCKEEHATGRPIAAVLFHGLIELSHEQLQQIKSVVQQRQEKDRM